MRQIILDTETTGLNPKQGHRIIEIGCVELIDRRLTGNNFHQYINPQRIVEEEAIAIHGITNEFLEDKPIFPDILQNFLDFVSGAELIAHNATFDIGFINHEMQVLAEKANSLNHYVTVVDTLALARKMFPGQRNSLDALCKRYKIDLSKRDLHGALLDAQLLAEVYLLMTGGQGSLFAAEEFVTANNTTKTDVQTSKTNREPLPITYANKNELSEHKKFLTTIKNASKKCLWENE